MSHTLKVRPEQIGGAIEPELDKENFFAMRKAELDS